MANDVAANPESWRRELLAMARLFSVIGVFGFGFYLGQAWAASRCCAEIPQREAAP